MITDKKSPDVFAITACAVFVLGVCQPAIAGWPCWTDPEALNNNAPTDSGHDWQPQVTTDGAGNWVAVWVSQDDLGGTIGTDRDILVARSSDNGLAWTDPAPLNNNAATDSRGDGVPQVTTDGASHWVAVWESDSSLGGTIGTDYDILVALSTDGGFTWTDPAPLNNNATTDSGGDFWPQVSTDGVGNWVAVWYSGDSLGGTIGTDSDILVAGSSDNGLTWTDPAPLNNNAATDSGGDYDPQVTTDGVANWVAVWHSFDDLGGTIGTDGDILVAGSSDNGLTWTDPGPLNNNAATDSGSDSRPQVTTDGAGNWVAVWNSTDSLGGTIGTDWDILVALSSDNCLTWTDPAPLNNNAGTDSRSDRFPQLTTGGSGNWVAVWYSDDTLGGTIGTDWDILVALSSDNCLTWTDPGPLNNNAATDSGLDEHPQVTTDGAGNWVAVWYSDDTLGGTIGPDDDILVARSRFVTADCNDNGIPDECDIDCGEPGGPCDLPGCGESEDCNTNSIPDECDIASGTSPDANSNGIPDECEEPPICLGDSDCDGMVSWRDIDFFVAAMNDDVPGWEAMFAPGVPTCSYANNDVNCDGYVTWRDIDPFVAIMNTTCP